MYNLIKFILISLFLTFQSYGEASFKIVVSIKPIHSLVASICQGITDPILLMTENDSPHTHSLTPQQLQTLKQADLVIWIGENYETPWAKLINEQISSEKLLTLIKSKGLTLYPYRQQCFAGSCHESHHHHAHEGLHHNDLIDGHIWLDISNVRTIANMITEKLITIDPAHKEAYKDNLAKLLNDLIALESDLKQQLLTVSKKTYLIYHDGLQYFDKFFSFQMAASLVIEPDLPPNAQDYIVLKSWLGKTDSSQRPSCVFTEPSFPETFSQNIADEFKLKIQPLDYIGINISKGPKLYFSMMRQFVADFLAGMS